MEDKWDIHTIFRLLMPGFISILIFCSYTGEVLDKNNVAGFAFLSIPIGYGFLVIYRFLYKISGYQEHLVSKDVQYFRNIKKLVKKDTNSIPHEKCCCGKWLANYYYAAAVDYALHANEKMKDKVDFLYTQMHTFGAAATTIIFMNIILCILQRYCLIGPSEFACFTIGGSLIVAIIMLYLMWEVSERIYVWRRLFIDNNFDKLERILQGEEFKKR
jgi:hypothetical protein